MDNMHRDTLIAHTRTHRYMINTILDIYYHFVDTQFFILQTESESYIRQYRFFIVLLLFWSTGYDFGRCRIYEDWIHLYGMVLHSARPVV